MKKYYMPKGFVIHSTMSYWSRIYIRFDVDGMIRLRNKGTGEMTTCTPEEFERDYEPLRLTEPIEVRI